MTPVNLSKVEINNIVKNELIVQHDTIICDPYILAGHHQTLQNFVWWWPVVKLSKCF